MKYPSVLSTFVLAVALAVVGSLAVGLSIRDAGAQDTSRQDHPLVGTWLADTDLDDETGANDLFTFSSDGTYIDVEADGTTQLGVWESTGDTTANLTIVGFEVDDEGNSAGSITIRASIEVGADGASFTAQYTIEFTYPDGSSTGQAGPGSVTGTRLTVEAPGTPVMTLEEMFSSFEGEPEASPEASPTS
ncbi:MAG: hypothetical protein AB7V46_00415 [Thermomicrobiales bacterium]